MPPNRTLYALTQFHNLYLADEDFHLIASLQAPLHQPNPGFTLHYAQPDVLRVYLNEGAGGVSYVVDEHGFEEDSPSSDSDGGGESVDFPPVLQVRLIVSREREPPRGIWPFHPHDFEHDPVIPETNHQLHSSRQQLHDNPNFNLGNYQQQSSRYDVHIRGARESNVFLDQSSPNFVAHHLGISGYWRSVPMRPSSINGSDDPHRIPQARRTPWQYSRLVPYPSVFNSILFLPLRWLLKFLQHPVLRLYFYFSVVKNGVIATSMMALLLTFISLRRVMCRLRGERDDDLLRIPWGI